MRLLAVPRSARLGEAPPSAGRLISGAVKAPSGWQDPSRLQPQGFSALALLPCGAGLFLSLGGGVAILCSVRYLASSLAPTCERPTVPYLLCENPKMSPDIARCPLKTQSTSID